MTVVTGSLPSPKFHKYAAMLPMGDEEAEPSNETVRPLTDEVNDAVGA